MKRNKQLAIMVAMAATMAIGPEADIPVKAEPEPEAPKNYLGKKQKSNHPTSPKQRGGR